MILVFVGKIKDVKLIDIKSQNKASRSLLSIKVVDIYTGITEEIMYTTEHTQDIETFVGKYISIKYIFFIDGNKAVLTISEQFQHKITDDLPDATPLVKLNK